VPTFLGVGLIATRKGSGNGRSRSTATMAAIASRTRPFTPVSQPADSLTRHSISSSCPSYRQAIQHGLVRPDVAARSKRVACTKSSMHTSRPSRRRPNRLWAPVAMPAPRQPVSLVPTLTAPPFIDQTSADYQRLRDLSRSLPSAWDIVRSSRSYDTFDDAIEWQATTLPGAPSHSPIGTRGTGASQLTPPRTLRAPAKGLDPPLRGGDVQPGG